jgi:GT2 family glycosyltransferase
VDISVITVNWNTRDLLLNCIRSVYETTQGIGVEIWVVDNGSSDGSVHEAQAAFPDIQVIGNPENKGFAKANNQALARMKGRYALLLNTDAVPAGGAVQELIRFMDTHRDAAVCGVQLLNPDGSRQNSIAKIPTLATEFLNKSMLRRLFPKKYPGKELDIPEPVEVESVIGACMIVRKEAIDEVGPLDESYFFFFEETDWCLRMRKSGWKVFHNPKARAYHLQGQTARKVNVLARIEYWRSRYIFFRKHYGSLTVATLKAGLLLRLIITIILNALLLVLSLFLNKKARDKIVVSMRILWWHLMGLPKGRGLEV